MSRLHERAGDDFLHVCPHDEDQMVRSSKRYFNKASMFQQKYPHITPAQVRLGGSLLLLHQLCQHKVQRRHQADHEQLHALHLCRGHVLPAEPHANDLTLLWLNCLQAKLESICEN